MGDRRDNAIRRATEWVKANRERYQENARASYRRNRLKRIAKNDAWSRANPDKKRDHQKAYRQRHAKLVFVRNRMRALRKIQATPPWADIAAIRDLYLGCPAGYHVDHIIPLRGKTVCGLHVENNLQIIPAAENLRKSNRLPPEL